MLGLTFRLGELTDWWDNSTVAAFKEKADCFVREYSNFTIPDRDGKPLHLNGRLTLGENIADAGGVAAAFASWKRRELENSDELLPGFQDFSKEQLFFLSYGNTWCGKSRIQRDIDGVYNDPHSPPKYRIMVSLTRSLFLERICIGRGGCRRMSMEKVCFALWR